MTYLSPYTSIFCLDSSQERGWLELTNRLPGLASWELVSPETGFSRSFEQAFRGLRKVLDGCPAPVIVEYPELALAENQFQECLEYLFDRLSRSRPFALITTSSILHLGYRATLKQFPEFIPESRGFVIDQESSRLVELGVGINPYRKFRQEDAWRELLIDWANPFMEEEE